MCHRANLEMMWAPPQVSSSYFASGIIRSKSQPRRAVLGRISCPCRRRCVWSVVFSERSHMLMHQTWLGPLLCLCFPRPHLLRNEEVMLLVSKGLINGLTIKRIYLVCLQLFGNDCWDGPVVKHPLLGSLSLQSLWTLPPDFISPFFSWVANSI